MKIQYAKQAAKYINKLDKPTKTRIKAGTEGVTETPPKGDIKSLQGGGNEYRLRIGKYRIIYEYGLLKGVKINEQIIYRNNSAGGRLVHCKMH